MLVLCSFYSFRWPSSSCAFVSLLGLPVSPIYHFLSNISPFEHCEHFKGTWVSVCVFFLYWLRFLFKSVENGSLWNVFVLFLHWLQQIKSLLCCSAVQPFYWTCWCRSSGAVHRLIVLSDSTCCQSRYWVKRSLCVKGKDQILFKMSMFNMKFFIKMCWRQACAFSLFVSTQRTRFL